MTFTQTELAGAFVIESERHSDERGYFARAYCRREFSEAGLDPDIAQCGISFNAKRGTLRGMHFQVSPHQEVKLVRCLRGSIFDVLVDLRSGSPTYRRWTGVTLTEGKDSAIYIPKGLAHGFQTLEDNSLVYYQISEFHHPESARGVRWNDPRFNIDWPLEPTVISDRDRDYPDFEELE